MVGLSSGYGIVLRAPDHAIEAEAARHKLPVIVTADLTTWPMARALIVEPGTGVPWPLVGAGFHLVETWDAAAPLMVGADDRGADAGHVRLATEVGDHPERKRTAKIVGDLRVPLLNCDLLFVRRSDVTIALLETWRNELAHGPDRRLAFLRAFFLTKPRLCALPSIWTGEARQISRSAQIAALAGSTAPLRREHVRANLVRVEYAPGKFVQCRPGDEAAVVAQLQSQLFRRRGRR
jgi:hypothetical protein